MFIFLTFHFFCDLISFLRLRLKWPRPELLLFPWVGLIPWLVAPTFHSLSCRRIRELPGGLSWVFLKPRMRVESLICMIVNRGWAKAAESLSALKSRALEVVIIWRSLELSYDPLWSARTTGFAHWASTWLWNPRSARWGRSRQNRRQRKA